MAAHFTISATNPCHLYGMARELDRRGVLDTYYSGYPRWKLGSPEGMRIQTHSMRTLVVYGLLKMIPERFRISNRLLFRWQDQAFDRFVARNLKNSTHLVAIPGQALHSFRRAKLLGVKTILSHATGPLETWIDLVKKEFACVGVAFDQHAPVDQEILPHHRQEYSLADFHWAPSQIVKAQLIAVGIAPEQIVVIPFGADPKVFRKREKKMRRKRILFAGQLTWRKGLRLLDHVIPQLSPEIELQFVGPFLEESREWVSRWSRDRRVSFSGAQSAEKLAEMMRDSSVLILPSVEESFGLVVAQALSAGIPCLVSDRVGAQDLIVNGENGEVLPWNSPESWVKAINRWVADPKEVEGDYGWERGGNLFLGAFEEKRGNS